MDMVTTVEQQLEESARTIQALKSMAGDIVSLAEAMCNCFVTGGKVLLCGNGGSAADAQHLAAELVGKLHRQRKALPAIALTTNASVLTAVANDNGFEEVFARQVEALANPGDVLIGISTSGNSENVLRAMQMGNEKKALTVGWTGEKGGRLELVAQLCLRVPSNNTQRIQECHITIGHIVCGIVEELLQDQMGQPT